MISTCTFNPSLDYYLEFEKEIVIGKINRSNLEYYEAVSYTHLRAHET